MSHDIGGGREPGPKLTMQEWNDLKKSMVAEE